MISALERLTADLATASAEIARLTAENEELSRLWTVIEELPTKRGVSITLTRRDRTRRTKVLEVICEAVVFGDGRMTSAVAGDFTRALLMASHKFVTEGHHW